MKTYPKIFFSLKSGVSGGKVHSHGYGQGKSGHFLDTPKIVKIRKAPQLVESHEAFGTGGGDRTPDTRIMIFFYS